jgi:methyltransferase (TIGR00027 family)
MSASRPVLESITDTARWVAMYRAMESDRPDAHFRDPYARLLAGARGEEILRRMPRARSFAWPMIVRTIIFDELILRCVERDGADLVVNLAAGLDTRPFRLPLPPTLRWAEVDLPEMLDYKEPKLAGERPHCLREVVRLDLRNRAARRALFARLGEPARRGLVVSEGLLVYLSEENVAALAQDLHAEPAFRWWLIDLAAPELLKRMQKVYDRIMAVAGARMQFAPAAGTEFFRQYGWREVEFRSTWQESHRLKREMALAPLFRLIARFSGPERRELFRRMGASVLLERVE